MARHIRRNRATMRAVVAKREISFSAAGSNADPYLMRSDFGHIDEASDLLLGAEVTESPSRPRSDPHSGWPGHSDLLVGSNIMDNSVVPMRSIQTCRGSEPQKSVSHPPPPRSPLHSQTVALNPSRRYCERCHPLCAATRSRSPDANCLARQYRSLSARTSRRGFFPSKPEGIPLN